MNNITLFLDEITGRIESKRFDNSGNLFMWRVLGFVAPFLLGFFLALVLLS